MIRSCMIRSCQIRRAALGGAFGLAVLAGFSAAPARAQDDDNSTTFWNFDKKIIDGMMHGLGLKNGTENSIDYKERSPLVVPPTRDLPPPQSSANAAAQTPNWPVDPDVKRRQASRTKKTTLSDDARNEDFLNAGNAAKAARTTGGSAQASQGAKDNIESAMKPSQLGTKGNIFGSLLKSNNDDEVGTFTGEPPRTSLVEPPVGYQTPSPAQPYGVSRKIDLGKPKKAEDLPVGDIGM